MQYPIEQSKNLSSTLDKKNLSEAAYEIKLACMVSKHLLNVKVWLNQEFFKEKLTLEVSPKTFTEYESRASKLSGMTIIQIFRRKFDRLRTFRLNMLISKIFNFINLKT